MSVSGIEAIGAFQPLLAPTVSATRSTQAPQGPQFAQLLANGIEGLEGMHDRTDNLAVQAATGDLGAIHDYTIAATETSVATQLTVAVRNKAIEAFSEIMRMQVG
jgi:flagellar hook-basal body complex protein FliE